jgi:hypothetical protein
VVPNVYRQIYKIYLYHKFRDLIKKLNFLKIYYFMFVLFKYECYTLFKHENHVHDFFCK